MNSHPTGRLAAVLVTTMLSASVLSTAEASPISYDYTFNPEDVYMDNLGDALCTGNTATGAVSNGTCQALEFTFVLEGFTASTDTLASGSLTLTFYDDTDPGPGPGGSHDESVNISLDGVLTGGSPLTVTQGSSSGSPFSPPAFNVVAELADGELTVRLALPSEGIGNNDFFFATSRLTARGEREDVEEEEPPTELPEPAGLLLFGMAAAGFLSRNRINR